MLSALSIRDIVLIEALDLEFGRGLAVLTGETGAGKSILLDSVGLVLGQRADAGLVRQGAPRGVVTACFTLDAHHAAFSFLADNDLLDGQDLVLRRVVKADGGSRAFVNDQPVSASLLRELGALLIEIHGQHDDRGLLNARGHRQLLDEFANCGDDVLAVADSFVAWKDAGERLIRFQDELALAARDREWLDHAVSELRALDPQPDEETALAEERATMQKGERLGEDLATIVELVEGNEGGLALLRQAARRLDRIAPEHPLLEEALAALDRAVIEAADAQEKLDATREALLFDPARLDAAETRLFELRAFARKHRVEVDALPALAEDLLARAARLDAGDAGLAELQQQVHALRTAYEAAAQALSAKRKAAARRLDRAVADELKPLKLDNARFRTVVEVLPDSQWTAAGCDRVEFEIATNAGAHFAPLAKIASGGELSRFMLALKVALAGARNAATLIFDEIDRGVGGAVASAIGERLARLSKSAQLLVVTHSPQVAARGESQWRISKSSDGLVTRTSVQPLDDAARREEIARMLSGAEITDEARAQAERLIEAN